MCRQSKNFFNPNMSLVQNDTYNSKGCQLHMISKEAGELLAKLNQLKSAENGDNKQLKTVAKNLIEYQSKIKKWLLQFDLKLSEAEAELKTLRQEELKQEHQKVKEIDNFQLSLKHLLDSYSKQAKNASEKLTSMVQSIKDEMRYECRHSIQREKASNERLKNMSCKLQKMIELVRSLQKKSIDGHQKLREVIRSKANEVMESRQSFLQESSSRSRQLALSVNSLQARVQSKLNKFAVKLDSKVFQTNKAINYLVQEATNL